MSPRFCSIKPVRAGQVNNKATKQKTKNQGNGRDSDNKNAMNKKFTAESRAYNT